MTPAPAWSPRLERAIQAALRLHGDQRRKLGDVPYVSHVIHVALLLQAHGFSEPVVCAGFLHDTLEDTKYTAEELTDDFGEEVCAIVLTLTENKHLKWERRKAAYIEAVRGGSRDAKAVCCADKIHNLATILQEYRARGDMIWGAFSRGSAQTARFYADALDAVNDGWDHPLVEAYRDLVGRATRMFLSGWMP